MTTPGRAFVAAGCLLVAPLLAVPAQAAPIATRAETPVHTLQVTGDGVGSYPAYDPAVERYAVTTTDATDGVVTVSATTSDPDGVIHVDGARDADGTATVSGLEAGDEVSVFITDAGGTARHSFVYLPARFPTLAATGATSTPEGPLVPGAVLLGLTNQGPDFFETAVDRHGVPVFVRRTGAGILGTLDLKSQPNGNFSISRSTSTPGRTGQALIQLDGEFEEVSRHETVGLVNTDGHDSIALPDGTVWLIAYEPNDETGLVDSVIQRIDPDGSLGFEWTSAPYADETVTPADPEYAHVNSIDLMDDGSILASFRGFSSVFKIATPETTGYEAGTVIWKLGGLSSTFDILDTEGAPDSGPCAQHTASELDDGTIVLFDNGASTPMCSDPADPDGPRVVRTRTRVLHLALDEEAGTAVVVREHSPGAYAQFAGSSQPLPDGDTLIGWSFGRQAVATQVDEQDREVWSLVDTNPTIGQRYFSYRAHLAEVPDVTDPTLVLDAPADGTVLVEGAVVEPTWTCHDRGGSSLETCSATPVDTSEPGLATFTLTATDGAGNTTTATRSYAVVAAHQPDAEVRVRGGAQIGRDAYGTAASQRAATTLGRTGATRRVVVRIHNDGALPDRFAYDVRGARRGFGVTATRSGTTPRLEPGDRWTLRLSVTRGRRAAPGSRLVLRVPVRSLGDPSRRDAVSVRVVASR
jgi:hypothetical protein